VGHENSGGKIMKATSSYRKLVSIAELAEFLGVSTRTVQRLKLAGVIRPYQVTPTCPRYDLDEVLDQLTDERQAKYEQ